MFPRVDFGFVGDPANVAALGHADLIRAGRTARITQDERARDKTGQCDGYAKTRKH